MVLKLSLDDNEAKATVYGIVSDIPDYRLCYWVNKVLGFELSRSDEDRTLFHKVGAIRFSEYTFKDRLRLTEWRLTSNKGGFLDTDSEQQHEPAAIPLVSALKDINYFLWYAEEKNADGDKQIISLLRENSYVRALREIDVNGTKNIEQLILDY